MAQPRIEKLITIKSIFNREDEDRFSLYDTEGNRYSGFKAYQGTPTNEYLQLKNGNHNDSFQAGQQALIQFVRNGQYLNLKGIYPADTTPKPQRVETPHHEAPRASQGQSKDDTFWDMKAYKQCLWGYFIEVKKGEPLIQADADLVWEQFQAIERDANNRFNPSPLRQSVERSNPDFFKEELPTVHVEDDELPPF